MTENMIEDHEIPIIVRSGKTGEILKITSVPARCARVTVFLDDSEAQTCSECGGNLNGSTCIHSDSQ